ncbi:hypothetical protein BJY52DRAFT_1194539 [Lactarius psammicola]|nr:hypothetical protein BJY52DRAFT_1194539 [Lactarius psammicola]
MPERQDDSRVTTYFQHAELPFLSLSRVPSHAQRHTSHFTYASASAPHTKQPRAHARDVRQPRDRRVGARRRPFALATRALPFGPPLMLDAPLADAEHAQTLGRARRARGVGFACLPGQAGTGGGRGVDMCDAQLVGLAVVQNVVARVGLDYVSDGKLLDVVNLYPPPHPLPAQTKPLVMLIHFGLMASTRCGSESYAPPELLVATHTANYAESSFHSLSCAPSDTHSITHSHSTYASTSASHTKQPRVRTPGTFDGRKTDAWA